MKTRIRPAAQARNRDEVIRRVFAAGFKAGATEVPFTLELVRKVIAEVATSVPVTTNTTWPMYVTNTPPAAGSFQKPWIVTGHG